MLATHGEFFPYAVGLGQSGELRMFAADAGDDEHPPSISDSDAIRVELEHRDGIAIAVMLRYRSLNVWAP